MTGAALWLKASDYNTGTGAWTDSSGNGRHGDLAGAAPTVSSINGVDALDFSGTYFALAGSPVISSQTFSIMAVVTDSCNGCGGMRTLLSNWAFGNGVTSVFYGTVSQTRGRFTDYLGGAVDAGNLGVGTINSPASPFAFTAISDASDASMFQDFSLVASRGSALPSRDLSGTYYVGRQGELNAEYWDGLVAEILVYDHALTEQQGLQNLQYFSERYSLDLAPVPEPSTAAMLGLGGGLALIFRGLRRRFFR